MQRGTRSPPSQAFSDFAAEVEPRLRHALVARFGPTAGRDAAVDAMSYGWEHWKRLQRMTNPAGYLYRVGQTKAKRAMNTNTIVSPAPPSRHEFWVEPALPRALADLSDRQRTCVILVHSFQWTHREVAEMLGLSTSSVQKHVERGMAKLRAALEVQDVA